MYLLRDGRVVGDRVVGSTWLRGMVVGAYSVGGSTGHRIQDSL